VMAADAVTARSLYLPENQLWKASPLTLFVRRKQSSAAAGVRAVIAFLRSRVRRPPGLRPAWRGGAGNPWARPAKLTLGLVVPGAQGKKRQAPGITRSGATTM